jgi:hypothetical protein
LGIKVRLFGLWTDSFLYERWPTAGAFCWFFKSIFKHADIEYQALLTSNRRVGKTMNDGSSNFTIGALTLLAKPDNDYISRDILDEIDF